MKNWISTLAIAGLVIFSSCASTKNISEPEFRDISGVRLIKVGLLQTTAGADLVYYNPNDFAIQLADARGEVYIDNIHFGRFELDEKVQVRKHAEFKLPVVFRLDNIGAIQQRDIYKKKEAVVRIEGLAVLRKSALSKEVPIRYERMQNIEQLRSIVGNTRSQ